VSNNQQQHPRKAEQKGRTLKTGGQGATLKLQTDITTVRNVIPCPQRRERLSLCSEIGEETPTRNRRKKIKKGIPQNSRHHSMPTKPSKMISLWITRQRTTAIAKPLSANDYNAANRLHVVLPYMNIIVLP